MNPPDAAEEIGPSVQRVNGYIREMVEQGCVEKLGQGRDNRTGEGVDRLIAQTERLADFTEIDREEVVTRFHHVRNR